MLDSWGLKVSEDGIRLPVPSKPMLRLDQHVVNKPNILKFTFKPFFQWRGTVVDLETTGLPPRWKGEPWPHVITLGLGFQGKIYVYQLLDEDYQGFIDFSVSMVKNRPRPLWAYSTSLEETFLGQKGKWIDLMQWGTGYSEWRDEYYNYRKSCKDAAYSSGLNITLWGMPETKPSGAVTDQMWMNRTGWSNYADIDGSSIPETWEKYLSSKSEKYLTEMVFHNLFDMLRETYLARLAKGRRRERLTVESILLAEH